jgi:hypothetical protein
MDWFVASLVIAAGIVAITVLGVIFLLWVIGIYGPHYRQEVDVVSIDPLFIERQRRRYASRAIAYLVLLNGVAALILLVSLTQMAAEVPQPRRLADAMLVFGGGAAIALGSSFFAYLRRTVRLQAPERGPLRVSLWWLSVLAALAAAACFLMGLNMAGRAALPEQAGISSGAKLKGNKERKDQSRAKREDRDEAKRDKREKEKKAEDEQRSAPAEPRATPEPQSTGSQPLSRNVCEQAGRSWNEDANICD